MPIFEFFKLSGKRAALIPADNIESIFFDKGSTILVTTQDGKEYRFHSMEVYVTAELGSDKLPEYTI